MGGDTSIWHNKRVFITGCTGFLGGAVARELLANGADVVGLVRDRSRANEFASEHAEGRFHIVHGQAEDIFRLHSAMAVYEVSAVFHLATTNPHAVVQATKLYSNRVPLVTALPLQQLALAQTHDAREASLSVARFGELFGPGDRKLARIVPATALGLLAGQSVSPADGPARDFVFVRDAARACLQVAEDFAARGPSEYSFRSGWLLTDRQMCSALRDVLVDRAVELPESAPPSNPMNWQPAQPFAEGLNETLAWCREIVRATSFTPIRKAA